MPDNEAIIEHSFPVTESMAMAVAKFSAVIGDAPDNVAPTGALWTTDDDPDGFVWLNWTDRGVMDAVFSPRGRQQSDICLALCGYCAIEGIPFSVR